MERASKHDPIHLGMEEGYDRWSLIYDDELNPLVIAEQPVVRGWIPSPNGLRVADVGCGTGRHTLWLAESGATVDAFDASDGMMSRARAKLADGRVRFHKHRLPDPLPVGDGEFDVVLFALVADHIEDLASAFHELHRVLRPGGFLIFTTLHPAMNLRGITARFTDPESGSEVRVAAYEHTCADYVMAPLKAGLTIDEMVERRVDQGLVAQSPRAAKYLDWPILLAMKLRRERGRADG